MAFVSALSMCIQFILWLPVATSLQHTHVGYSRRQLPTIYSTYDKVPQDSWYNSFRLVPANRINRTEPKDEDNLSPLPVRELDANISALQFLVREQVCIRNGTRKFVGPNTVSGTPSERTAVQGLLNVQPIPTNHSGPVHAGLTVVLTVHHFGSYYWGNIEHVTEAVLPIFDTLHLLGSDGRKKHNLLPITNILLHQAWHAAPEWKQTDWVKEVLQMLAHPAKVNILYRDNIKHDTPVCVQQALLLDRPSQDEEGNMERHFFTFRHTADAWRQTAFEHLGVTSAQHRLPGRKARFILRKDTHGFMNQDEIVEEVRNFLAKYCWSLTVSVAGEKHPYRLKEQVEESVDTDLSISVHGAHLTNIMWQAKGSGVLVIEKCDFEDKDYSQLARESGLLNFTSHPTDFTNISSTVNVTQMFEEPDDSAMFFSDKDQMTKVAAFHKHKLPGGTETSEIHQVYRLDFARDMQPVLLQAMKELEMGVHRGPKCPDQK